MIQWQSLRGVGSGGVAKNNHCTLHTTAALLQYFNKSSIERKFTLQQKFLFNVTVCLNEVGVVGVARNLTTLKEKIWLQGTLKQ